MEKCPKCGFKREPGKSKCPKCGVIYEIYNYYLDQHNSEDKKHSQIICPVCETAVVRELASSCPTCGTQLYFEADKERIKNLRKYSYGQMLLREREYILEKIYREHDLDRQIRYFSLYTFLFSAIYGFSLGMFVGGMQILAALIKIPLLLFGSLFICLPALYTLNILFGIKLTFKQTLTMLLASTYLMSVMLGSLSPILLFFITLTATKSFISSLNIIMFGISSVFGLRLLWIGMRYLTVRSHYHIRSHIVKIWYIIYVVIVAQLAWILRPFIGEKGHFEIFREIEGNVYLSLYKMILNIFN